MVIQFRSEPPEFMIRRLPRTSIRCSWLHDLGTSRKRSEAPNFMIWGLEDENCTEARRRVFTIVKMEFWCISCMPRISIYPYFESLFRTNLMKQLSLLRQCENCESGISACQDHKKKGIGEDDLWRKSLRPEFHSWMKTMLRLLFCVTELPNKSGRR